MKLIKSVKNHYVCPKNLQCTGRIIVYVLLNHSRWGPVARPHSSMVMFTGARYAFSSIQLLVKHGSESCWTQKSPLVDATKAPVCPMSKTDCQQVLPTSMPSTYRTVDTSGICVACERVVAADRGAVDEHARVAVIVPGAGDDGELRVVELRGAIALRLVYERPRL